MRGCIVAWLLAAGGVLAAASSVADEQQQQQQKALGSTKLDVGVMGQFLSCEETYGAGWERCGDQVCLAA